MYTEIAENQRKRKILKTTKEKQFPETDKIRLKNNNERQKTKE